MVAFIVCMKSNPQTVQHKALAVLALASSDTFTLERSSLAAASILYLASLRSWKIGIKVQGGGSRCRGGSQPENDDLAQHGRGGCLKTDNPWKVCMGGLTGVTTSGHKNTNRRAQRCHSRDY